MDSIKPLYIPTIAEFHRLRNLPKPVHPLISLVRFEDMCRSATGCPTSVVHNFYCIALKKNFSQKIKYGQQDLDFDEGLMHFMSPKQVLTIKAAATEEFRHSGWLLLIHPDFLWNTALSSKIKQYDYFSYQVNEALHLSEKEEVLVTELIQTIALEYQSNMDNFSQSVLIAQIELLLIYADRFYQRQFMIRKKAGHSLLNELEILLTSYFNDASLADKGIPTVQFIAGQLHVSANYLSRLLQQLTGRSTKQFIHDKLIDLAKEKLSTTSLSVNEIAYSLGFEHPQSFSKLFRSKTEMSPLAFRISFN